MQPNGSTSRWSTLMEGPRRIFRSLLITPLVLAFLLMLAMSSVGQFSELFVSAASRPGYLPLGLGFAGFALFAVTMFFGYLSSWVVMRQTGGIGYGSRLIYETPRQLRTDRLIVVGRDLAASLCAILPLLGVAWALHEAAGTYEAKALAYQNAVSLQIISPAQSALLALPSDFSALPEKLRRAALIWTAMSLALLLALHLYGRLDFAHSPRKLLESPLALGQILKLTWRSRIRAELPIPILVIFWLAVLGPPILLQFAPDWLDLAAKTIHPIAVLGLSLLTVMTLLVVVGNISRHAGIPILLLTVFGVLAIGIWRWSAAGARITTQPALLRSEPSPSIDTAFLDWIDSRADRQAFLDKGLKYPVFIVAAQGGGIYAASSAGAFLAKLQDSCANFSQHVFAISAVSGGAIGSAVFNAMGRGIAQSPSAECINGNDPRRTLGNPPPARRFQQAMSTVIRADHFSPTIAATLPDVIFKLAEIVVWEIARHAPAAPDYWDGLRRGRGLSGRAEALECSFLRAFPVKGTPSTCSQNSAKPDNALAVPFSSSWASTSAAPALVLNTTWAETGDRVAFAPFDLTGIGDGSLSNVRDLRVDPQTPPLTLMQAAIASARFPAMMPAKILKPPGSRADETWWNLVDGGYADASGSTTALEIYKKLRTLLPQAKQRTGLDIDLKLVVLADSLGNLNRSGPSGDGLIHAISPLTTILNVRTQIARRSVLRAEKEVLALTNKQPSWRAFCSDHEWPVRLVILDQDSFKLPLGWMISHQTDELISRLIGSPMRIDQVPSSLSRLARQPRIQTSAYRLYDNTCTMYSITQMLSLKGAKTGVEAQARN